MAAREPQLLGAGGSAEGLGGEGWWWTVAQSQRPLAVAGQPLFDACTELGDTGPALCARPSPLHTERVHSTGLSDAAHRMSRCWVWGAAAAGPGSLWHGPASPSAWLMAGAQSLRCCLGPHFCSEFEILSVPTWFPLHDARCLGVLGAGAVPTSWAA